jgi:hypothetical protein
LSPPTQNILVVAAVTARFFEKNAKELQKHHQLKPVFDQNLDIHACKGGSEGTTTSKETNISFFPLFVPLLDFPSLGETISTSRLSMLITAIQGVHFICSLLKIQKLATY